MLNNASQHPAETASSAEERDDSHVKVEPVEDDHHRKHHNHHHHEASRSLLNAHMHDVQMKEVA